MRVKFCGITRYDDAEHAARLGAWAVGLNHWEGSTRRCDHAVAAEIGAGLRRKLELVGIFVDQPMDEIVRAAENEHLSLIQLHGKEGLSFCHEVKRRTGCPVIKAIRVRSSADIDAARSFRVDLHLLDAYREGMPGGTGQTVEWDFLRRRRSKVPMILAGGLTHSNVAEAIGIARPWAVDVASGIESAPGIKDHELMSLFVAQAEEAGGPSGPAPVRDPEHFVESMEKDREHREAQAERARADAEVSR